MLTEDATPTEGLRYFFHEIWGDTEGFVYLPTQDPKTDQWKKYFFRWPEHSEHVVNHVLAASAEGKNSFFAPAIFKEPKPEKTSVKGTNVVWTDFDGNAPESWNGDAPLEGQEGPQDGLRAPEGIPAPSLRVQSSREGHEHVYWKLDEFAEDVSWIDGVNRSLAYSLRADTSGWDANQILRPPFTTNYKHDLPVTIAYTTGKIYPSTEFKALKPVIELVSESIDTENLPTVELVIAKYPWDEEHFKMFMDPQVPEGKRSSALMRLGYFGAEVGMTDVEIYALLENADSRWGKFVKRTDRKKRLLDIVNRAKLKHPNKTSDISFAGLRGESQVEIDRRYIYGFNDFLSERKEVEWVFEGLLEKGGFFMIASAPGVGKTQVSLQLAINAVLGKEFLGYRVQAPQRVVFFSLEMAHNALWLLLDTISKSYSEAERAVLQRNLLIVPIGESLPIERAEARQFMHMILDQAKPDGIIIDSVSKLANGKFNAESVAKLNDFYLSLRARYGSWMCLIHHNRKPNGDNKRPTDLGDVYGEVFITAEMTAVWTLWRDRDWPKNKIELNEVKNRLAPERDPVIIERDENLMFRIEGSNTKFSGLTGQDDIEEPGTGMSI